MKQNRSRSLRVLPHFLLALAVFAATVVSAIFLLPRFGYRWIQVPSEPILLGGSELEEWESAQELSPIERPRNLIVVIGDGLGFAHIAAARAIHHGIGADAEWDRFESTGWHRPRSARGFLVDSASAATALASGVPTHNGRIGANSRGEAVLTLLESASEMGYRTGLITDSYFWDATPAAFVAHAENRGDAESIIGQIARFPLEVLVGELTGLGERGVPGEAETRTLLGARFEVFGPSPGSAVEFAGAAHSERPIAAIYDEGQLVGPESRPNLRAFVAPTLERLSSDHRPFVLVLESEELDTASHHNDFERTLDGLELMAKVLEVVLDFAEQDGETLVVFTGDHETGGLVLRTTWGPEATLLPIWTTTRHTGAPVPLFAYGPGSGDFVGTFSTWEVGRLLLSMLREDPPPQDLNTQETH